MSVIKQAADDLGIQITRKNGKSSMIAKAEAVNTCRKLWHELGLDLSDGFVSTKFQPERDNRLAVYNEIAAILLGDDVPEFEILT